jgi:hypothetical protein
MSKFTHYNTMTITIEVFTNRELIYCISTLIYDLTQEQKLDDNLDIDLWIAEDWGAAEEDLKDTGASILFQDDEYHLVSNDIIHYSNSSKRELIREYFNGDVSDYEVEPLEHWLVSQWLADRLEEHCESVVRDFYGLTVWARCTSGQAIYCDYVIQEIYRELISK